MLPPVGIFRCMIKSCGSHLTRCLPGKPAGVTSRGRLAAGQHPDDPAIGGARKCRPGLIGLLTNAEAGNFDVVVCEAIDRLGRNLADAAALFDRLTFRRVAIYTVSNGLITQVLIGFMGTVAQMSLTDLRD